ncbi:MAG: tetratricopeptide repeat protein [Planctomycetes bacterium]|nr:tetratricopeptide repeat protein [Planctomycetota bacterium]
MIGRIALGAAIVAAVICTYWPIRDGDFVFDDEKFVAKNGPLWAEGGVDFNIFGAASSEEARANVRPLRFLSYKLDVWLTRWWFGEGERRTIFFHAQNILLHAANALLILALARGLLGPAVPIWVPAAAALAFALHPVHTESVAYISGRRDVLFLFFYLLALLVYLRARAPLDLGGGMAVLGLFIAALLAKEMAITLPAALLAVEWLAAARDGTRARLPWALLLAVIGAGLVMAAVVLGPQEMGGKTPPWGGTVANAVVTSARAQIHYLGLLLYPHPLTVDYSFDAFPASAGLLSPPSGLAAIAAIGALIAGAAWLIRRGTPWVGVGILFFFAALLPVAQIVPHPERMAEHFLYLPSIGFLCAAGGIAAPWAARAPWTFRIALVVLLLAWAAATRERIADWRSSYSLWKSAVAVAPRCARAQFALAYAAREAGRPDEAIRGFTRAIELLEPLAARTPLDHGRYLQARRLRGELTLHAGDHELLAIARADFEALLAETDTDGTRIADNLDVAAEFLQVQLRLGDFAGAERTAARIIAAAAAPPARKREAVLARVEIYMQRGERARALEEVDAALAHCTSERERAAVAYLQGDLLARAERWAEARAAFRRSAELIGGEGRRSSALYREAECVAQLGDADAAAELLRALLAADPGHLPAQFSLADLSLAAMRFDEAERCYRAILEVAPGEARALDGLRGVQIEREVLRDVPAGKDPSRVLPLLLLAERYLAAERLAEAAKALAEADRNAEGPAQRANRMEARLKLARTHARLRNWEEADAAYVGYLELAEDTAVRREPLLEAAAVRAASKGAGAARELLEREWERGLRDAHIAKRLALLAEQLGDAKGAAEWLRRYVELESKSFGPERE